MTDQELLAFLEHVEVQEEPEPVAGPSQITQQIVQDPPVQHQPNRTQRVAPPPRIQPSRKSKIQK